MVSWPSAQVEQPGLDELERMALGADDTTATDGCPIEPDGVCEHGHPSWLLRLGFF